MLPTQFTEDGIGFVKAATAATDFQAIDVEGIPDSYAGKSVTKKSYFTTTVEAKGGESTYFIITPTPDTAYWKTSVADAAWVTDVWPNNQALTSHTFPDATTIFPGTGVTPSASTNVSNTVNVSSARCMALSAEMVCLNNAFNQFGSIASFKTPLRRTVVNEHADVSSNQQVRTVAGTSGLANRLINAEAEVTAVRDGAYAVSMNKEEEFEFNDVLDNESKSSTQTCWASPTELGGYAKKVVFSGPMVCFDNGFDTIVFRIDVPSGVANQSFLLKTWKIFEYQPTFNSLLYSLSSLSPPEDRRAIQLYRAIERELPVAVPAKDNPDFWDTVLAGVREVSNLLPGPIGVVAKGAHAVGAAIHNGNKQRKKSKTRKTTKTRGSNGNNRARKGGRRRKKRR